MRGNSYAEMSKVDTQLSMFKIFRIKMNKKERLDHLAFSSFPEDYLPYATSHRGGKGGSAPYLVWEDERRGGKRRGGRRGCCSTAALVSAIALIVTAILAAVAISVYLGVVTNLFRSPVMSLSGKFRVSDGDEFSDKVLNSTSLEFLKKAESYQAMVENALLTSSLEPAFIAARIYAFRPGMLVFFRVYLDRRKLQQDDSETLKQIRELVRSDTPAFGSLTIDQESVDVDENEEWITFPGLDQNTITKNTASSIPKPQSPPSSRPPPPRLATVGHNRPVSRPPDIRSARPSTTQRSPVVTPVRKHSSTGTGQVVPVGPITPEEDTLNFSYGQWNPVPIEDSVSPSFGDQRTPPGRGSAKFPDVSPGRPPPSILRTRLSSNSNSESPPNRPVRPSLSPAEVRPPSTSNSNLPNRPVRPILSITEPRPSNKPLPIGVGSVSVLEDPLSHVDPIPIRGLRLLENGKQQPPPPQGPQGEVASSIMSSVSLVVRPPNKDKSSSGHKLETGGPKPDRKNQDERESRKEQSSYRFIEDSPSGDSENGSPENLFSIGDSSGAIDDENVDPVNEKQDRTVTNTGSASHLIFPKESFVEYVESSSSTTIPPIDETVRSKEEVTNPNSKVATANQDILSSTKYYKELYEDSTSEPEATSKDKELLDTILLSHVETTVQSNSTLQLYSTKSDIDSTYLNVSVDKYASTILPPTETTFIVDKENTEDEEENYSSLSTLAPTELISPEINTADSATTILFESEKIPIFEGGEVVSSLRDSASSEDKPYSADLQNENLGSESDIKEASSTPDQDNDTSTEKVLITSTQSAEIPTKLISNPLEIHSQEGHGFHKPPKESSVLHSIPEIKTEVTTSISTKKPAVNPITESVNFLSGDKLKFPPTETTQMDVLPSVVPSTMEDNKIIELEADISKSQSNESMTNPVITTGKPDLATIDDLILENREEPSDITLEDLNKISTMISTSSVPPETSTTTSEDNKSTTMTEDESTTMTESESTTMTEDELTTMTKVSTPEISAIEITTKLTTILQTTEKQSSSTTVNEEESGLTSKNDDSTESTVVLSGKIVPHLSDLGFNPNDINSDGESDSVSNGEDLLDNLSTVSFEGTFEKDGFGEIIRHITTVPPPTIPPFAVSLGKHPVFVSQEACLDHEWRCGSGECIDHTSRCNMKRDCRDNSDEKNCSCADLLRVMGQSQKICDGVDDCRDRTDERDCPWCEDGQVACAQTKFCIDRSQLCDGNNDCPLGTDERYCVKLAESVSEAEGVHYRSDGYLMVRKEGRWGKLCLDSLGDSEALRLKLGDLGEAVCSALTYRNVSGSTRTTDPDTNEQNYYVISNEVPSHPKQQRSSAIFKPSSCESREVLRVECGSLDCGLRPLATTNNRRRIVGGQSSGSGSWPWQVALYKEGDFQCGAVLVSDTWLVSAGHCFYSTQDAYWIARLGLLRRGSELPNPSEQVRRISKILLHPQYVDKGFVNDIALLRMDAPVLFSDYLRPVCLPTAEEDPGLWHGKQCSVVGWGKLYEIGHTFPDSLQEVRLPVISTEECRKRILFLTMYHITDNMFCAGYERGGRDACLGDSGGPLMCQRDDGRWLLLGVTSNGDGCGRPGRPGVYTKVVQYLDWIRNTMDTEDVGSVIADRCEGTRCQLGRCIPPYKVCDGRWDCSEGADEDHCEA
ncbi:hypothetical protein JTE90_000916 [Oedothorax gibbosus]|uniref:Uncharacterized protein n=1 Tax=Oedothorax gibbosus TaxID=931172 RepID=A0AAV6VU53_9ARAC|nr:hypothetical protein JTE90_000916 [Oedothorax gibbosus]